MHITFDSHLPRKKALFCMFFQPKHGEPNACVEMLFKILSVTFTEHSAIVLLPQTPGSQFRFIPCSQLSNLSSYYEGAIGGGMGEYF